MLTQPAFSGFCLSGAGFNRCIARGCMRTYLILKEKSGRFKADAEIQGLLAEIHADDG